MIDTASNAVTEIVHGTGPGLYMEVTSTRVYLIGLGGGLTVIDQGTDAIIDVVDLQDSFNLGLGLIPRDALVPGATPPSPPRRRPTPWWAAR